jgi:O-antigen/teichoic acid export membrane protein
MQFKLTAIMALINILLNIILIPILGSTGAAISTLFAFSFGAVLSYIYGGKIMHLPIFSTDTFKITLSAFLVILLSHYMQCKYFSISDTLINISILVCSYVFLLILLNTMNIQKKLRSFIKKSSST